MSISSGSPRYARDDGKAERRKGSPLTLAMTMIEVFVTARRLTANVAVYSVWAASTQAVSFRANRVGGLLCR